MFKYKFKFKKKEPARFEPGTFSAASDDANHYTRRAG
jgi:hypothetical protein